ncbi:MAG: hypothetical protein ACRD2Z_09390 [Thermoanaerobaculia bacterium]
MTAPAESYRASFERVREALEDRGLVRRARADHLDALCPAHDDHNPSLTVDWRDDRDGGRVLVNCHRGCAQPDVVAAMGLEPGELFDVARKSSGSRGVSPVRPVRSSANAENRRPRPVARPPRPIRSWPRGLGKPETVYRYTDDAGELLGEVGRFVTEKGKTFRWRHPVPGKPGLWFPTAPERRELYRLPELIAAVAAGGRVYVVEGEKDVDRLAELGEVATCNAGGAGRWSAEYAARFAGAHVTVIADRDDPGYRHAAQVAASLAEHAASVDVVRAVLEREHADVSDHLAAGMKLPELEPVPGELLEAAGYGTVVRFPARGRGGSGGGGDSGSGMPSDPPPDRLPVPGSPGWWYASGDSAQVWKGDAPVLDWCPEVLERLVTLNDDGTPADRYYSLRVGEDPLTVRHAELRTGEVWDRFPDAVGTGERKAREVLLNVVTDQARRLTRIPVVTRTGWHDTPTGRIYVYGDGRTYPAGAPVRLIGATPRLARAALPPSRVATDEEIRAALAELPAHGWGPLMGLGAGARSMGQSLHPVPAAFVTTGEPHSGKTMTLAAGRMLLLSPEPAWPPLSTGSFRHTSTRLEMAVDSEADMATLLDDLALTSNASAIEVREAAAKLESIIRPVGNQDEIRGRATRELLPRPARYVRSIPGISAQKLPPTMQESLYRRAVVLSLRREEFDYGWYRDSAAATLTLPLRAIGDRIVARLAEGEREDAERLLGEYDTEGLRRLAPAMDAELPGWGAELNGLDGVVRAAGAMLGGLLLIADLAGIDRELLAGPVCGPLARSLGKQAEAMRDRHAATDDLAIAVGEVVRAALHARRAHIRNDRGHAVPAVPGQTEQAQGLRRISLDEYDAAGAALYWLSDHGALGVRSAELHTVLAASRDPRVIGYTARSLPGHLLNAGAVLPSKQKGRLAAERVRVGNENPRLLLLRPSLVFDLDVDDGGQEPPELPEPPVPAPDAPAPASPPAAAGPLAVADSPEPCEVCGEPTRVRVAGAARHGGCQLTATPPATRAESPAPAPPAASEPRMRPYAPAATDRPAVATVMALRAAELAVPGTGAVTVPHDVTTVPELVEWAAANVPGHPGPRMASGEHYRMLADDGQVWITAELAAVVGLPASRPADRSAWTRWRNRLAELLKPHGWEIGGKGSEPGWWLRAYRPRTPGDDRAGLGVELGFACWAEAADCELLDGDPDPATLAGRLARFTALTDQAWAGGNGRTAQHFVERRRFKTERRLSAGKGGPPKLPPPAVPGPKGEPPQGEHALIWQRAPEPDELALPHLHAYDGRRMHLASWSRLQVGWGAVEHVKAPTFDPTRPGYWLYRPPVWDHARLPNVYDPRDRLDRPGRQRRTLWATTPALAGLAELGWWDGEVLEAWVWPESVPYLEPAYNTLRPVVAELEAAKVDDPDAAALLAAVKGLYKGAGKYADRKLFERESWLYRPDIHHFVIADARTRVLRAIATAAEHGRYPLAIATDCVLYASDNPDPIAAAPPGFEPDPKKRNGRFKPAGTAAMADAAPLLAAGHRLKPELLELLKQGGDD